MADDKNYKVVWEAVQDVSDLKARWLAVEAQTTPGFFLSWTWMGSLIHAYNWRPHCLTVYSKDQPVAIGLLGTQPFARHGFVRGRGIFLNETGVPAQDQIWIEYNDFLVADAHPEARRQCHLCLFESIENWDECSLSGVPASSVKQIRDITDLRTLIDWQVPTYQVDLESIHAKGADYLGSLSRNTRYQIRRAVKAYEQQGELKLIRAQSLNEALAMFDAAGEYHRRRWGEGVGESGYANPEFTKFHHTLIKSGWTNGEIELLLLQLGSKPLAYFYNFVKNGRVYFYLSGIVQETQSVLKPGLVGHALAIQDYLNRGMLCYDFMGGDARYKKNLGERGQELARLRLQRPRLSLGLEHILKAIKQTLKR